MVNKLREDGVFLCWICNQLMIGVMVKVSLTGCNVKGYRFVFLSSWAGQCIVYILFWFMIGSNRINNRENLFVQKLTFR